MAPPRDPTPPFSLRLTFQERTILDRKRGSQPLGAYIRDRVLEKEQRKRKRMQKPRRDERLLAAILAELQHSHMAGNINQIARNSNLGSPTLCPDERQALFEAREALIEMCNELLVALRKKKRNST